MSVDDGMDYDVQTKVSFRLDFDGSGEFNMLLLPDIQKQFVQHVKKVYEKDDTFSCHDENKAEAESFSDYCVRGVQKELEGFGCKIRKIDCKAEEADMSWYEAFEDAVFGPRDSAQKQPPAEKTASKKKTSRQER